MNPVEATRKELEKLQQSIGEANDKGVAEAVRKLDGILRDERARLPGPLAHFLDRRSYQKALAYVREEEPPEGERKSPSPG